MAVLDLPRHAPGIGFGEIAQPIADAAIAVKQRVHVTTWERIFTRGLEMLPFTLAALLISTLVWGAYFLPIPLVVMLLGFDLYWAWRSINMGIHTLRGYRAMKATALIDWRQKYDAETLPYGPFAADNGRSARPDFLAWDDIRHLVIIPTYKETVEKLRCTLGKLAESEVAADKLLVVIAMEEPDTDAPRRFEILHREFAHHFLAMVGTTHPGDIAGEVRGKSSNEVWAATKAKRLFCDQMGFSLDHMTVRAVTPTRSSPALLQRPHLQLRDQPQALPDVLAGAHLLLQQRLGRPGAAPHPEQPRRHQPLAKLMRKYTVLFPQSTYSLSMRMSYSATGCRRGAGRLAHVPQVLLRAGRRALCEPILLPVGNDGVRAVSYKRTFWEHYQQARATPGAAPTSVRHQQFIAHPAIPFLRKLRRTWSLTENHVLWSAQWFLITGVAANMSANGWSGWVGLNLHPFAQHNIPTWFITASHWILMPCMIPLLMMIVLDMMMRPARPKRWKVWLYPIQFIQWALMAPITLFFTACRRSMSRSASLLAAAWSTR